MSYFKNLSEQICKILNRLSYERRMVIFGDTNRFEGWLVSQQSQQRQKDI
ncbi:8133_t:CDS:2 [Funneliformis geosporum]|nr:8133_t:CDS:2 [Funneliformis geosporum]